MLKTSGHRIIQKQKLIKLVSSIAKKYSKKKENLQPYNYNNTHQNKKGNLYTKENAKISNTRENGSCSSKIEGNMASIRKRHN